MHLSSGTRLGAYEIVSAIGAGGMGEVYRARDTRLDRTVALKVLPSRFDTRPELRERFEREARVVSSLNHPNICALYDVGQHDGLAYFVMEYIEGQSLAERIAKGPLPLDQTLRYAIDVAGALDKAHRHGVIHRDLKPGNVMLTKGGAKLLDFGLARRAGETRAVLPEDATAVAGAAPLTAEGTIVGTLQYMSPEQLEGGELDARTDIFSFGAVLYEMVTGQRAFSASSHASLITKIMSEHPRPVRELVPVTPARLEQIIHRCLEKDPDKRWQCSGDLAAELRAIGSEETAAQAPARKPALAWTIAAVLLVVAGILGWLLTRKSAVAAEPLRFELAPPTPDSRFYFDALSTGLAVSPDGRQIVFINEQSGQRTLWVRRLDASASTKLEGTAGAVGPFWSPDGRSVAFFAGGKLQAIDVAGGAIRTICNISPGATYAGSWSPDGTIVFTELARDGGLYAVPASGGTPRKLPPGPGLYGYHFPQFLSDGKRFLFAGLDVASPALYAGFLDGTPPRRLQSETARVAWVPPHLVYFRDGSLVAQRFDEKELKFDGPAIPLGTDAQVYWLTGASAHAASAQTLVALSWGPPKLLRWVDRNGRETATGPPADYFQIRVSPDGRRVAAAVTDRRTGVGGLWTIDTARKTLTRASFDKIDHDSPVWSPDGRQIVFTSDVEGPPHLFIHDLASGKSEMLLPVSELQFPGSWIDDGRIFFQETRLETRGDILTVSPADKKPVVWRSTPFSEIEPSVSPDRKWVVFLSDESGAREIYAAPIDRPREAVRLTTGGGSRVRWSRDGREIYFLRGRDLHALAMKIEGDSIAAAEPVHLFTATSDIQDYDVDPNGQFVLAQRDRATTVLPLTVMLNWQAALEKK